MIKPRRVNKKKKFRKNLQKKHTNNDDDEEKPTTSTYHIFIVNLENAFEMVINVTVWVYVAFVFQNFYFSSLLRAGVAC